MSNEGLRGRKIDRIARKHHAKHQPVDTDCRCDGDRRGGQSVRAAAAGARSNPVQAKTAPTRAVTACDLLTKEDAAAALGEAVKGPDASSGRSTEASSCEYSGSGLHVVHLNLMHFSPDTAAVYRSLCAQKGKEGLSGLGDVACWYSDKHEELQVLKGGSFFSVELRKGGDPTEAIKGVAKKVFDRLP